MTDDVENARAEMVKSVVDAMGDAGEALSHESVAAKLPDDFDYSAEADDYEQHVGAEMAATESSDGAAKPSSPETMRADVVRLDTEAHELRASIVVLQAQLGRARSAMGDALGAWHTGERRCTAEANARSYIASEQAERQRLRDHGPNVSTEGQCGNSYLDRAAFGSARGHDANDAVRSQLKRGWRRSGLPASMRGARLPSNRV